MHLLTESKDDLIWHEFYCGEKKKMFMMHHGLAKACAIPWLPLTHVLPSGGFLWSPTHKPILRHSTKKQLNQSRPIRECSWFSSNPTSWRRTHFWAQQLSLNSSATHEMQFTDAESLKGSTYCASKGNVVRKQQELKGSSSKHTESVLVGPHSTHTHTHRLYLWVQHWNRIMLKLWEWNKNSAKVACK